MIYNLINAMGKTELTTTEKKELEAVVTKNVYGGVRFFDINGNAIPYRVKCTIGTSGGFAVGASLSKIVVSVSAWGRNYVVQKGISLLKILNYDKKMIHNTIITDKGKRKIKYSFSLVK